jgi:hypothetical protein
MRPHNDTTLDAGMTSVFLTPKQLSSRWQCSLMKLRRMRRAHKLGVHYIGRSARYSLTEVQRIENEAKAF